MDEELVSDIIDILNEIDDGWEFCMSRGMVGHNLSEGVTEYIASFLRKQLGVD